MIEFTVDKIKIYGPKVDGGYTVTFEVGEYEQNNLAELMKLKQGQVLKVKVENDTGR